MPAVTGLCRQLQDRAPYTFVKDADGEECVAIALYHTEGAADNIYEADVTQFGLCTVRHA